ncbi:MAG: hypothetical protein JWO36_2584 [Myxococcales bacterium]|nr:hypothetical protein [Myxococcales bacterium]
MPDRKPPSYDDITRKTVPNLDSSFRPTREQEQQAREGFRALDADEQQLADSVQRALAASGVRGVTAEVERNRVTLRGQVRDAQELARIPDLVRSVPGVGDVIDQLVIAAR